MTSGHRQSWSWTPVHKKCLLGMPMLPQSRWSCITGPRRAQSTSKRSSDVPQESVVSSTARFFRPFVSFCRALERSLLVLLNWHGLLDRKGRQADTSAWRSAEPGPKRGWLFKFGYPGWAKRFLFTPSDSHGAWKSKFFCLIAKNGRHQKTL